ncbi:unnamed protein product [Caenorhabditis auriculariae]|uniref:Protein kinase domain-containing protein n=1 Tax=Caenorhabditis auriculariae TaxID=2777116 RepID=A0A8S1HGD4_9PELO|nr:unnamed protein product [Caenorhabditis auriculariae]
MALWRAMDALNFVVDRAKEGSDQLYAPGDTIEASKRSFKVTEVLGTGGFGTVFKAVEVSSKQQVAIKVMLSSTSDTEKGHQKKKPPLCKKISKSSCLYIAKMLAYDSQKLPTGVHQHKLVLELGKFCLANVLRDYRNLLSDEDIYRIGYQTTMAIACLHELNITHRDVKSENVLITSEGVVKICDFGSATSESIDVEKMSNSARSKKHTTPLTRTPEVCDMFSISPFPIGTKQDVWGLGCFFFFLCYNEHPFDGGILAIVNAKYRFPQTMLNNTLPLKQIISNCLVPNPDERPTAINIAEEIKSLVSRPDGVLTTLVQQLVKQDEEKKLNDQRTETASWDMMKVMRKKLTDGISQLKPVLPVSSTSSMKDYEDKSLIVRFLTDRVYLALIAHDSAEGIRNASASLLQFVREANQQFLILNFSETLLKDFETGIISNIRFHNFLDIRGYQEILSYINGNVPPDAKILIFGNSLIAGNAAKVILLASSAVEDPIQLVNTKIPDALKSRTVQSSVFIQLWKRFFTRNDENAAVQEKNDCWSVTTFLCTSFHIKSFETTQTSVQRNSQNVIFDGEFIAPHESLFVIYAKNSQTGKMCRVLEFYINASVINSNNRKIYLLNYPFAGRQDLAKARCAVYFSQGPTGERLKLQFPRTLCHTEQSLTQTFQRVHRELRKRYSPAPGGWTAIKEIGVPSESRILPRDHEIVHFDSNKKDLMGFTEDAGDLPMAPPEFDEVFILQGPEFSKAPPPIENFACFETNGEVNEDPFGEFVGASSSEAAKPVDDLISF